MLAGEGWHEGVKGIVASRLTNRFGVPTILFTIEDGVALGQRPLGRDASTSSARWSRARTLLTRFGGHAAAVGCALPAEQVDAFRECLLGYLDTLPAEQFEPRTQVDAEVELEDVSVELGAEFALLEPFGHGNRTPLLARRGRVHERAPARRQAGNHCRFTAYDGAVDACRRSRFAAPTSTSCVGHETAVDLAFEVIGRRVARQDARPAAWSATSTREAARPTRPPTSWSRTSSRTPTRSSRARSTRASRTPPSFHTKLAGVTFEGRQDVLEPAGAGTPLRLERQPDNAYDANACALFDPHGDQVGFFNRRLAAALAPAIDAGVAYDVEVTEVTGGEDDRSLGVNVLVSQPRRRAAPRTTAPSSAPRGERSSPR